MEWGEGLGEKSRAGPEEGAQPTGKLAVLSPTTSHSKPCPSLGHSFTFCEVSMAYIYDFPNFFLSVVKHVFKNYMF